MSTHDDFLYTVIDWNKKGDYAKYQGFVESLKTAARYNAAEFFERVRQLTPRTYLLDPSCRELVNAILEAEWIQKNDCFVSNYATFLSALVSAHASWAAEVMKMLMKKLKTRNKKRSQQYEEDECVHNTIKAILDTVPGSLDVLSQVLESEFPEEQSSIHAHLSYVRGILRILDYAPILHAKVIGIVVDRIIRMDSVCPLMTEDFNFLDSQMAYDAAFGNHTIPDSTHAPIHVDNPGPADPSYGADLGAVSYPDPEVVVNTLDVMLYQVFMYLDRFVNTFSGHSPPSSSTSSCIPSSVSSSSSFSTLSPSFPLANEPSKPIQGLYAVLLLNFTESILHTSASRHAQYLVFYLTSLSPMFIDHFLGTLIHRIVHASDHQTRDAQTPPTAVAAAVERGVAAVAYLPSFLIHARYVSQEHIRMIVELLSDYALDVVKKVESTAAALANANAASNSRSTLRSRPRLDARLTALLDTGRNTVFYAVVQALIEIFCDHWRTLQVRPDEGGVGRWHLGVEDIPRIVESRLNPLQMCTDEAVKRFSKLAQVLDLMGVVHPFVGVTNVIATGVPVVSANTDEEVKSEPGEGQEQVQKEMPRLLFEPYRLTLSAPFVKALYVEKMEEEEEGGDILLLHRQVA